MIISGSSLNRFTDIPHRACWRQRNLGGISAMPAPKKYPDELRERASGG